MLQHDNTRPRTACTAHDVVASLKFEIVSRPPYSPDLIPSYFLPELRRRFISSQTMKWRQQWNLPSKVSRENSSFAEWKTLRVGQTVFNSMLTAIILKSKYDILHLMNYTFIFFTFHFDNCSHFQNTCRQLLCIFYKTRKSKELRCYLRSLSSTSPVLSLQITCLPKLCDSTFIRCPMYFQYQIRYSSGRI